MEIRHSDSGIIRTSSEQFHLHDKGSSMVEEASVAHKLIGNGNKSELFVRPNTTYPSALGDLVVSLLEEQQGQEIKLGISTENITRAILNVGDGLADNGPVIKRRI